MHCERVRKYFELQLVSQYVRTIRLLDTLAYCWDASNNATNNAMSDDAVSSACANILNHIADFLVAKSFGS